MDYNHSCQAFCKLYFQNKLVNLKYITRRFATKVYLIDTSEFFSDAVIIYLNDLLIKRKFSTDNKIQYLGYFDPLLLKTFLIEHQRQLLLDSGAVLSEDIIGFYIDS